MASSVSPGNREPGSSSSRFVRVELDVEHRTGDSRQAAGRDPHDVITAPVQDDRRSSRPHSSMPGYGSALSAGTTARSPARSGRPRPGQVPVPVPRRKELRRCRSTRRACRSAGFRLALAHVSAGVSWPPNDATGRHPDRQARGRVVVVRCSLVAARGGTEMERRTWRERGAGRCHVGELANQEDSHDVPLAGPGQKRSCSRAGRYGADGRCGHGYRSAPRQHRRPPDHNSGGRYGGLRRVHVRHQPQPGIALTSAGVSVRPSRTGSPRKPAVSATGMPINSATGGPDRRSGLWRCSMKEVAHPGRCTPPSHGPGRPCPGGGFGSSTLRW